MVPPVWSHQWGPGRSVSTPRSVLTWTHTFHLGAGRHGLSCPPGHKGTVRRGVSVTQSDDPGTCKPDGDRFLSQWTLDSDVFDTTMSHGSPGRVSVGLCLRPCGYDVLRARSKSRLNVFPRVARPRWRVVDEYSCTYPGPVGNPRGTPWGRGVGDCGGSRTETILLSTYLHTYLPPTHPPTSLPTYPPI